MTGNYSKILLLVLGSFTNIISINHAYERLNISYT
ncbi:hypothetical protein FHR28_001433 [Acinetobacter sp. BIGb0196]|nr:hypothetical protein [Acinetobacter guillouiae]MCW2252622.1 hypothetical protein [Acinetobacter sp. BIGb0204]NII36524.1 hypothetical protein [Acinetobacter sp. BIGb0196]